MINVAILCQLYMKRAEIVPNSLGKKRTEMSYEICATYNWNVVSMEASTSDVLVPNGLCVGSNVLGCKCLVTKFIPVVS